eukprot:tig00000042_g15528.t2
MLHAEHPASPEALCKALQLLLKAFRLELEALVVAWNCIGVYFKALPEHARQQLSEPPIHGPQLRILARRRPPPPRVARGCPDAAGSPGLEDRDRAALAEQLSRQLASFASQHARASAAAASAVSPGYDAGADEGAEEPGVERERLFVAQQAAALRVRLVHGLLPTLHDQRPAPRRRRRLRRVPLRLAGGVPAAAPRLPAHPRRPRPTPLPQRPEAQASRYPLSGPCTEALDVDLLQVQV